MYTNKELEEIYDERYKSKEGKVNLRETILYNNYRKILLPNDFLSEKISNLDLGCGRGHKTIGFSSKFERVLAVDLSQNVIDHCKHFYSNVKNIEFVAQDATVITEKFNLITAFGFSLFNTSDNDLFLSNLFGFMDRNLLKETRSFLIIGSFTDFSGGGADSWYLHTKEDLAYLCSNIEKKGCQVKVVFPHKIGRNYFGAGIVNFVAEAAKLLKKKKRTFFIVIEHEQN